MNATRTTLAYRRYTLADLAGMPLHEDHNIPGYGGLYGPRPYRCDGFSWADVLSGPDGAPLPPTAEEPRWESDAVLCADWNGHPAGALVLIQQEHREAGPGDAVLVSTTPLPGYRLLTAEELRRPGGGPRPGGFGPGTQRPDGAS